MKTEIQNLFKDLPPLSPITDESREKNSKRVFTGSVRINNGKYRTKKEDTVYRMKSLKRELP